MNFSFLQNEDVTDAQKRFSLDYIKAGFDVNPATGVTTGDFIIDNTANVEIKAPHYILFEPGFVTVPGAVMNAHIESFTGDCTNWVPAFDKTYPKDGASNTINGTTVTNTLSEKVNSSITMLPNPFKSGFTVNFNVSTDGESTAITVFDITGRLVYQHSGTETLGVHSYNVPVNSGTSLYIVKACVGGECKTQKMVRYEKD